MLASDAFSWFRARSQKAREGSALGTLNGTGCMDEWRAHKSQILRVSRVNPLSGEVVAANASLLAVYDHHSLVLKFVNTMAYFGLAD
jgi:hypothetical protein